MTTKVTLIEKTLLTDCWVGKFKSEWFLDEFEMYLSFPDDIQVGETVEIELKPTDEQTASEEDS